LTTSDENLNSPEIQESIRYSAVAENHKLAKEAKKRIRKDKVKKGFYYSFLTVILLFCVVQVGFGAILNISKTLSYKAKINTLEKVRDEAELRNKGLKEDIKQFSDANSLEEIARNNLKMAGEDEVLFIINKNEQKESVENKKKWY